MNPAPKHQSLPMIVDTPTPTPRLGFENYVGGVAAAIMGGLPARYTVGLYGPWGSGKSSLLAAIRHELSSWPYITADGTPYSITAASPDAPIIVDFDAWRYADKGSLIVSMLLRIREAVQRRTETASHAQSVQQKLLKTAKVLTTVIQNIEVSAWGVTVGANSSAGQFASGQDLATALMPFEQLEEIGHALPVEQRLVVLVDDLDRCSPAGVVKVIEAIHVLTDITGIVFVLALDYEYLTSAIRTAYPTTDPDRFIEKIVQVPFHVPAPKIDAAAMPDIIPSWLAIEPWVAGVKTEDIRAIMRIGLRSNPRQIKRLFNTFLLFAHMDGTRQASGAAPGRAFDNALALKVLGLQVAWPAAFAELLRELSAIFNKAVDECPVESQTIGKLDTYSGWWSGENLDRTESTKEASGGDGNDDARSRLETQYTNTKHRKTEGTRHYTQESLERLRAYLQEVLTERIPSRDIWKIMVMAQDLVQVEVEQSEDNKGEATRLQETLDKADPLVRERYTEIAEFLTQLPEDNSMERPQYFRISRRINDKTRVFGQMRVRPTQGTVRLEITFGTAMNEAVEAQDFSPELQVTVDPQTGQVDGVFVLRNVQTPGMNLDLQRILRFAHEHVKP